MLLPILTGQPPRGSGGSSPPPPASNPSPAPSPAPEPTPPPPEPSPPDPSSSTEPTNDGTYQPAPTPADDPSPADAPSEAPADSPSGTTPAQPSAETLAPAASDGDGGSAEAPPSSEEAPAPVEAGPEAAPDGPSEGSPATSPVPPASQPDGASPSPAVNQPVQGGAAQQPPAVGLSGSTPSSRADAEGASTGGLRFREEILASVARQESNGRTRALDALQSRLTSMLLGDLAQVHEAPHQPLLSTEPAIRLPVEKVVKTYREA